MGPGQCTVRNFGALEPEKKGFDEVTRPHVLCEPVVAPGDKQKGQRSN